MSASRPPAIVSVSCEVPVPVEEAFQALTDWEAQGQWMPATRVRVVDDTAQDSPIGLRIEAFSGWGRIGFLDTMHVTGWDPPHHCEVLHTGALVKGPGHFRVQPVGHGPSDGPGDQCCVVTWEEHLSLPLSGLGRMAWIAVRHPVHWFFSLALNRFARYATRRARNG